MKIHSSALAGALSCPRGVCVRGEHPKAAEPERPGLGRANRDSAGSPGQGHPWISTALLEAGDRRGQAGTAAGGDLGQPGGDGGAPASPGLWQWQGQSSPWPPEHHHLNVTAVARTWPIAHRGSGHQAPPRALIWGEGDKGTKLASAQLRGRARLCVMVPITR